MNTKDVVLKSSKFNTEYFSVSFVSDEAKEILAKERKNSPILYLMGNSIDIKMDHLSQVIVFLMSHNLSWKSNFVIILN